MNDFYIISTEINEDNVYVTMNKKFGINYMLYLTCKFKDNPEIDIVGSNDFKTLHFKLKDKDTDKLINNIKEVLV